MAIFKGNFRVSGCKNLKFSAPAARFFFHFVFFCVFLCFLRVSNMHRGKFLGVFSSREQHAPSKFLGSQGAGLQQAGATVDWLSWARLGQLGWSRLW